MSEKPNWLEGVRVLEVGGELSESAGKLFAGLGADVVKVEPPEGEVTRGYGPFVDDVRDANKSLHFWHFNLGKRSIMLDLDKADDQQRFAALAAHADIVIDGRAGDYMETRGLGADALKLIRPELIYARITPFGDTGPWANWHGSDLVHLALGGVMMNCGYDRAAGGHYDTPPIAPQMWQAYQIAGDALVIGVLAALIRRTETGVGQTVSVNVHEAVSKNTEQDVPNWVYRRTMHHRQTARHSTPAPTPWTLARTRDERYLVPYRTYLRNSTAVWARTVSLLEAHDVVGPDFRASFPDDDAKFTPEARAQLSALVDQMAEKTAFEDDLWLDAQHAGLTWAPVRRPEENLNDAHWQSRETFLDIEHPELVCTLRYVGARWFAPEVPWAGRRRPPLLGEHGTSVADVGWDQSAASGRMDRAISLTVPARSSPRGPFALPGLRILDLSWLLASGGAGRFFTALGAEVIKVEHSSRWDGYRWGVGKVDREGTGDAQDPNRSGAFMDINAGKRSLGLDLKSDSGKAILAELIGWADVVLEGFSPGTMDRMGFGYARMKELNPDIIYVQQTGLGQFGTYGRMRSYGPTAQAMSGLTEMSGLPDPAPPAGIGYSYLDWFGAYNMAVAVAAALHRRSMTGLGCHIDASQTETGIYLTGTAVLDFQVNDRPWSRYGNRSPYKLAAPHGAFPTQGEDRWIALSCFDEQAWCALIETLGSPEWAGDARFADLDRRCANQDELEHLVAQETARFDAFELMRMLQAAGVPAGVCQTAQDRVERDPQLAHLGWMVDLNQRHIGRWPVKELPFRLSDTPTYVGGSVDRSGPSYGEDSAYVLRQILNLEPDDVAQLIKQRIVELAGSEM